MSLSLTEPTSADHLSGRSIWQQLSSSLSTEKRPTPTVALGPRTTEAAGDLRHRRRGQAPRLGARECHIRKNGAPRNKSNREGLLSNERPQMSDQIDQFYVPDPGILQRMDQP